MAEGKAKTAALVVSAINDLREASGSTVNKISKFIEQEYEVPNREFRRNLKNTLKWGVQFGALVKVGGRYMIGEVLKHMTQMRRPQSRITTRRTIKRRRQKRIDKKRKPRRKSIPARRRRRSTRRLY